MTMPLFLSTTNLHAQALILFNLKACQTVSILKIYLRNVNDTCLSLNQYIVIQSFEAKLQYYILNASKMLISLHKFNSLYTVINWYVLIDSHRRKLLKTVIATTVLVRIGMVFQALIKVMQPFTAVERSVENSKVNILVIIELHSCFHDHLGDLILNHYLPYRRI